MTTRFCDVCERSYNGDERFCPNCFGRYQRGDYPFDQMPKDLKPFLDGGTGRIKGWDFEQDWLPCERIRVELYKKLHSSEARRGTKKDQAAFERKARSDAKREVQVIIDRARTRLINSVKVYDSTPNETSLKNFKI